MSPKKLPVTDAWRANVEQAMLARNLHARELARLIGCNPGTLSKLLSGQITASALVYPISRHLRIAMPFDQTELSEDELLWLRSFQQLSPLHRLYLSRLATDLAELHQLKSKKT